MLSDVLVNLTAIIGTNKAHFKGPIIIQGKIIDLLMIMR